MTVGVDFSFVTVSPRSVSVETLQRVQTLSGIEVLYRNSINAAAVRSGFSPQHQRWARYSTTFVGLVVSKIDCGRCAKLLARRAYRLCVEASLIFGNGFLRERALFTGPVIENPSQVKDRISANQAFGQVIRLN
jgi:hypothetical protein